MKLLSTLLVYFSFLISQFAFCGEDAFLRYLDEGDREKNYFDRLFDIYNAAGEISLKDFATNRAFYGKTALSKAPNVLRDQQLIAVELDDYLLGTVMRVARFDLLASGKQIGLGEARACFMGNGACEEQIRGGSALVELPNEKLTTIYYPQIEAKGKVVCSFHQNFKKHALKSGQSVILAVEISDDPSSVAQCLAIHGKSIAISYFLMK